jgi:hypothetical protein
MGRCVSEQVRKQVKNLLINDVHNSVHVYYVVLAAHQICLKNVSCGPQVLAGIETIWLNCKNDNENVIEL